MLSFADLTDRKTVVIALGVLFLFGSAALSWYGLPGPQPGERSLPFLGKVEPFIQMPFRILIGLLGLATAAMVVSRKRISFRLVGLCALVLTLLFPHALLMWDPPSSMKTALMVKQAADLDSEIYNNYLNKEIPWDPTVRLTPVGHTIRVFGFIIPDRDFLQLSNVARWLDGLGLGDRFLQFIGMGWALALGAGVFLIIGYYLPGKVPRPRPSRKRAAIGLTVAALLGAVLVGRVVVANYHLYRARDYAAQGLYQKAIKSYRQTVRWAPPFDDNSGFHTALGAIYYHTSMDGESDFYNYIGDQYFHEGLLDRAEIQYRKALEIRPDHPIARSSLIATLLNMGIEDYNHRQYASARMAFEKVLEVDPDNMHALYELGSCHIWLRNYDLAIAAMRRVIALQAFYQLPAVIVTSQCYFRISWCHYEQGEYQRALEVSRQAVTLMEWD
ncbi:MAG: tetratricopeptide repeat protein [Candidatus Eisenbacteria bacterium]